MKRTRLGKRFHLTHTTKQGTALVSPRMHAAVLRAGSIKTMYC
jgi:hypothetical protein